MTNEHPIDAIGAANVTTQPTTEPLIPTLADLVPAAVRAWVYALLGIWLPIYLLWTTKGAPPDWLGYVTAGLSGSGFLMAGSNVPRKVKP